MKTTDKRIKEKLLLNDNETFNQIYYEYKNLIYYKVTNSSVRRCDRDDVVQEIFIKLVENINTFDYNCSSLKTWILCITKNHIIDYLKKANRIVYDDEYIDNITCVENQRLDFDVLTKDLTDIEKDVLVYKTIFNFSHKEIAETLGITIDISKKIYKKAKDKVTKEALKNEA